MNISATALSTFELCERKWAWKALDGVQGQNRFAAAGTDHHAELEAWLRDKKLPTSHVVQRALPHFPHPGPDVLPEQRFEGWVRGWRVVGVIDALHLLPVPQLFDLKTTSDLRWAKTEAELRADVQAALYAAWACITFEVELVALRWVYVERKRNGRVRAVDLVMSGRQAIDVLKRYDEIAHAITHATGRAIDQMPNWNACEQYGGCPYKELCGSAPLPVEPSMIQDAIAQERNRPMPPEMSIAEKMKAKIAAAKAATPAVNPTPAAETSTPAPAPEATPAPAAAAPVSLLDAARASKADKATKPAPPLPPAPEKVVEEVLRQHMTVALDVAHRAFDAAVEHVEAHLDNPAPRNEQPIDLWRAQLLLDVAERIKRGL